MADHFMENFAKKCTSWFGGSWAFFLAFLSIAVWLITGPLFEFSTTWQLIVNTITTIVTFLMVFLIQRTQNKDSFAVQMKLNELIAAHAGCSNRLINVEDLSEGEIVKLYRRYQKLAVRSKLDEVRTHQHTVEEIEDD